MISQRRGHFALVLTLILALASAVMPTWAQGGTQEARFATFSPGPVDSGGQLQPYTAQQDFGNVVLSEVMTDDQKAYLLKNLFVVSPSPELEFYTVYEKARYNYQPLFITTDSMLHIFHLAFSKVLRTSEREYFLPLLKGLNAATLKTADGMYNALKGTDWEQAALHTVAYLGVASKLVDEQTTVPVYAKALVDADYAAAMAAEGISPSAIFPALEQGEDWSQYKPRSYYADSPELSAYFRSMMWYGRMTFRLSKPEETKAALLLTLALRTSQTNNKPALAAWADLYEPTVFFIGKSDDLNVTQYNTLIESVYGANVDAKALQGKGDAGIQAFVAAAQQLPAPRILGTVIKDTDDVTKETMGLRFMGQRFVWDAYVLRQMIYRNVGTQTNPRAIPSALDVFAAMGSERARAILEGQGASKFENYTKQADKVRAEIKDVTEQEWTETLYNSWLYATNTLNQPATAGYPSFMLTSAYADRTLSSALGSYTELKHDTVLYAKQAYAEMGGGGGKSPPPEPVAPPNYVEPVPLFWARLGALAEMTLEGLSKRSLLNELDQGTLTQIASWARKFQTYSQKELRNELLTSDEQSELRFYGGTLEALYKATYDSYEGGRGGYFDEEPRAALVADIATDPQSQQVLQIGTGAIDNIYAVVPVGDKLWLARGAVFSFYEFKQPLNNRLTDKQWWAMLDSGSAPARPEWTASFLTTKTVDSNLKAAVQSAQFNIRDTLWNDPVSAFAEAKQGGSGFQKYLITQLDPLVKAGQYEGRQLIETSFRSFDMKDQNTAIVTTREIWRGELWNNSPQGPDNDGTKVAERGPYTVDVTYTLTYNAGSKYWSATNVVVKGTLPAWTQIK